MKTEELKKLIRDVPDFPKKGIIFKDITTLIKNGPAFREIIDRISSLYSSGKIDRVIGVESRGFIFGAPVAYNLGAGIVPIRKKGKLPAETISYTYSLEYGEDTLQIHKDAVEKGQNILIVDDLLATGGTSKAAVNLVEKLGGKVAGIVFVIELEFLNGRQALKGYRIDSLLKY